MNHPTATLGWILLISKKSKTSHGERVSSHNTVTHETIKLCDDSDSACIAALQEKGYYMLTEEKVR